MAIERDEVELKPCPFCSDQMVIKLGLLQHVEQGDCLIGANAWDEHAVGRWNAQFATLPDVDTLSQIIRRVDGQHSLGAGELAERILSALSPSPHQQKMEN